MNLEIIKEEPTSDAHLTPILFIHGMWHGAWCWKEHFLPYFAARGYVSCAMSLRGHGSSEGKRWFHWTSLKNYVSDVEQVVSQMESPPVLVGHSMGGMVVQRYLESNESPAAVLLASVPPGGVFFATLRFARRHPLVFLKTNLTLSMYPVIGTPQLAREAFFTESMPEEKVADYFSRLQDESYRAYLNLLYWNLVDYEKISTPMLVLGAEEDGLISQKDVRKTAEAYRTEAKIFPEMGHDMMLEAGWQEVADRIIKWLDEQGI